MPTTMGRGKVVGNTVILEPDAQFPDGASVLVQLLPETSTGSTTERQQSLRRLLGMQLPVAHWEQMEDEIIRGATE